MAAGLLILALLVVLVVAAVRKAESRQPGGRTADVHAVRRFFQYLLLYGLLVVVTVGLSGLLGRLLESDVLVRADEAPLARSLAFTVVGVPLFVGLALWSRRRITEDPEEARSLGWAFYVSAASLTSLVVAMTQLHQVLEWATGQQDYDGRALASFVVWGASWVVHWLVDARVTPPAHAHPHHLLGSLIGLVTAATGLAGLLAGALRSLLGLEGDVLAGAGGTMLLEGLVTLAVGAPVWFLYWSRTAVRYQRDPLWLGYVLLAGVAGGLVTAIIAASTLIYSVLVWLVGEPRSADPAVHFDGAPTAAAAALVGTLVWWYHHALLEEAGAEARTEVRRVYEYLMAGVALLAGAGGLATVIVALIEAVTGTAQVLVAGSAVNTLLVAATLLGVGGPVWWVYWRRIQRAARAAPSAELASPSRRIYLFVLLGLGGVAAVVALLVGVFFLFEDVVEGTVGAETLRRMRVAIGVLVTSGAIASYHLAVYRADRGQAPSGIEARGPSFVLLVGPTDADLARAVARRTQGRVQAWSRADDGIAAWSVDEVMAALEETVGDEVIVLADPAGPRVIPIHRRPEHQHLGKS